MRHSIRSILLSVLFAAVVSAPVLSAPAKQPMTREQARKFLADHGDPETPDGLLAVLETSIPNL
ncbi:MAG: hypothetical protein ABI718_16365, partial [Acidobacteriota bacterium]